MQDFESLAETHLTKTPPETSEFLNEAFLTKLLQAGKTPEDSQARAAITGETFENCILSLFDYQYPQIKLEKQVDLEKAFLTGQSAADFVVWEDEEMKCVIEAKGSAEKLEWPTGEVQKFTRPGLKRTDTVKKAVCQAYQVKKGYPQTKFAILTSHLPEEGSASWNILQLAEGDVIDYIIDVTDYDQLNNFVTNIRTR